MGSEPGGIFLAKPERPRDGIRLAVKDLFDTAGLTTTYGSVIYAEHVPDRTAGSVRIPAAWCGVVGFKPTYGLVPLEGCFPLAPSFDHAGPMATSVPACTVMMGALADGFEPRSVESLEEFQVGVAWLELADPVVRARVGEAAELFPRRRTVEVPLPEGVGPVFMR